MTGTPRFQKKTEDFTCEKCGHVVKGSGYTNHCPKCLWSKHVDINPGDRAAACQGLMEPIAIEGSSPEYRIMHRCTSCGYTGRVKISPADDPEAVLRIAGKS
jgi:rubrerythrin